MTYRALFLCTANSARSLIAESILRKLGAGRFEALSAGSHPSGRPNPHALEALQRAGYPTEGLRSKSWDEFAAGSGPNLDFVFTVCDNAAGEMCPIWPGQPMTAHWGVPDPAAIDGNAEQIKATFFQTMMVLERRIRLFVALRPEALDRLTLTRKLVDIGKDHAEAPAA